MVRRARLDDSGVNVLNFAFRVNLSYSAIFILGGISFPQPANRIIFL